MSKFSDTFSSGHVFLPVIHVISPEQALENTKIAVGGGADGVFLINHHGTYHDLLVAYKEVRNRFPSFWIGLNFLDLGLAAISRIPQDADGLWVDDAGIDDQGVNDDAFHFRNIRRDSSWQGLYFGGVAFKGQRPITDLDTAVRKAKSHMDVITTSGKSTGSAPPVDKMRNFKEAADGHPLAVASGMDKFNVEKFMPYVDCFLVATGISKNFTALDPRKTEAFGRKMRKR